jgi:hypothetical protein
MLIIMNTAENNYSPKKSLQYVNATLQYTCKLFSWHDIYYVHKETVINPSERDIILHNGSKPGNFKDKSVFNRVHESESFIFYINTLCAWF